MTIREQMKALLTEAGWDDIACWKQGHLHVVSASYKGVAYSGAREDGLSLVAHLIRVAKEPGETAAPVPPEPQIIERTVEVPVEVERRVVEYRDNPEQARRIAELEAEIEARARPEPPPAGTTFRTEFLEAERLGRETLQEADIRLLAEYEALEASRPLGSKDEIRLGELFGNFYEYRG